jgi:hypothetical protein
LRLIIEILNPRVLHIQSVTIKFRVIHDAIFG